MRRFAAFLLAFFLILGIFSSCGEQPAEQPAFSETPISGSEEPASGSEPVSESEPEQETDPATEPPEPLPTIDKPVYENEYVAPEDGSFTICGVPLSEYTPMLYWGLDADYNYMERKPVVKTIEAIFASAGCPLDLSIAKSAKYDTTPIAEHEILFGVRFQREGIPEYDSMKNYYGVTEDGTVYFCSPSPILYPYLLELFVEEFLGVAPGSGEQSGGCAISPCYRELPRLDVSRLQAEGYALVLDEPFDGDALNLDLWNYRADGARRVGFSAYTQTSVRDGNLILTGSYLTDGVYGEGWYGTAISLKNWYCRGYFESRIRCSETIGKGNMDFWSAFWIQGPSPYEPENSQGGAGPGGAELDILENFGPDCTTCTVWVAGYEGNDGLSKQHAEIFCLGNNYVEEYHVYSLLWTEDFYGFYLDGVLLNHTSFGYGTSPAAEEVILSMEVPNEFASTLKHDLVREMFVDYLRIWQKPVAEE